MVTITAIHNTKEQITGYVLRHLREKKIVVAFRGTAGGLDSPNWRTDFNAVRVEADFEKIDQGDGLEVLTAADLEDDELAGEIQGIASIRRSTSESSKEFNIFGSLFEFITGSGKSGRTSVDQGYEAVYGPDSPQNRQILPQNICLTTENNLEDSNEIKRRSSVMSDTIFEGAEHMVAKFGKVVTDGVNDGMNRVFDGVETIVDRVGESVEHVAMKVPLLDDIVKINVHSGFWHAYLTVRKSIHRAVRRYIREGDRLLVTGHSLGGALATFAALDLTLHTVRPFNEFIERRCIRRLREKQMAVDKAVVTYQPVVVTMYNYGSPRVGSRKFAEFYNQIVPDSFRIVVDGDVVVTLPFSALAYRHIGCLVIIDAEGLGSIIIDPSDVEKKLRTKSKAYINNHQLIFYKNGLEGVLKRATNSTTVTSRPSAGP